MEFWAGGFLSEGMCQGESPLTVNNCSRGLDEIGKGVNTNRSEEVQELSPAADSRTGCASLPPLLIKKKKKNAILLKLTLVLFLSPTMESLKYRKP